MYYVKHALWRIQVFVDMVSVAMDLTKMTTSKHAESDQQQQGRRHKSEAQSTRKNRMKLQLNQLATICAAQPRTIQWLSIMPRIPQIEDLFVRSPDVDPHKNDLIKLLLFKPLHAHAEVDEQGDPTDPYEQLYKHRACPAKHYKGTSDRNPACSRQACPRHCFRNIRHAVDRLVLDTALLL